VVNSALQCHLGDDHPVECLDLAGRAEVLVAPVAESPKHTLPPGEKLTILQAPNRTKVIAANSD